MSPKLINLKKMKLHLKKLSITLLLFCSVSIIYAQVNSAGEVPKPALDAVKGAPSQPKAYSEIITSKAVTDKGMFNVHKVGEKYFYEIPDSLLKRHILVVNRVSRTQAGGQGGALSNPGDLIDEKVIMFENGPNNKIFIRTVSHSQAVKDSTSSMFTAVSKSNIFPISAAFDIKAFSKDSTGSIIDFTDFIAGDNEILYLSTGDKSSAKLGALQADKSYVTGVTSFPINIEVTAVKTFAKTPSPGGGGSGGGSFTVELNSSMVLLPKVPMQGRYADNRTGYFTIGYTDYDLNPQGVEQVSLIKRFRLEPKKEDIERYKRGELVEPAKPIVFYIDPATPEKWIPYLIQGVNDWQGVFEKAGFKNAIFGKRAPTKEENPEWSLLDARHSAIVYKASTTANASGPSIADPRSGEIIESHVNWFHNVMSLVRNWYMIQAGPLDARARKMLFDDELMGELIRFVSSHEVGHTLGLRHNFGSSSTVPVDSLRSKAWVEANGHTPSIMDYARFNYVAQPEDNITAAGIFPRIGIYDAWAINWGYRRFYQFDGPEQEKAFINSWIIESTKDPRLQFGEGEFYRNDPRNTAEQIGDDPIKGSIYGIMNLKRVVSNLIEWTTVPNENYQSLNTMYTEVVTQFKRYNGHVAARIAGVLMNPKSVEQPGAVFEAETRTRQKEAIMHLNEYVFKTPVWILNPEIFEKTGVIGLKIIESIQEPVLENILKRGKLDRLVQAEIYAGNRDYYPLIEFLDDIKRGIWGELNRRDPIDIYRRQLQQIHMSKLNNILNPGQAKAPTSIMDVLDAAFSQAHPDYVDVTSTVRAHVKSLKSDISKAIKGTNDKRTKTHLIEMERRAGEILDFKK